MSTLPARLAAALEPLAPETKAALAKLLLAGVPKAERKPRVSAKDMLLLDTRTVAELWLAGETGAARDRAERAANKTGGYRSILVTFADGFSVRTGSYMANDEHAKAAAVRLARGRAMEREFAKAGKAWLAGRGAVLEAWSKAGRIGEPVYPPEPGAYQWARPCDGVARRTRACAVPEVASVEFVACEAAPELCGIGGRYVVADGEFCRVDFDKLRRDAKECERMKRARMVGRYPLPVPLGVLGAAPEVVGPCCVVPSGHLDAARWFNGDADSSALEGPRSASGDSEPLVPPDLPSPDVASQAPAVVPFKRRARGKRDPRSWALVSPEGFVLYVGPKSGAQVTRVEGTIAVPLPLGWRRGANPWAGEDRALIVENARAKVAGERQRVRVKLAA